MTARKTPKKSSSSTKQKADKRPTPPVANWKRHAAAIGVAILITVGAYANATHGAFIYDDEFQILKNSQIKPGGDIWQAVTSDVWSFQAGAGESASNYWRPVFTGWLALNYRLFGLETTGWHVMNILSHLLVTVLGYRLLVMLRLRPAACAIAVWVFAAHPAHVQSVTWISGSPDLLMAVFLMGSMICYLAARDDARRSYQAAAVLLYALALLSKETALAFILILFFSDMVLSHEQMTPIKPAAMAALKRCAPFLAAALVFVVVRYQLLHHMRQLAPDAQGFSEVLLTMPSMLVFYIRQSFFPFIYGPIYGVRYVNASNISLTNILLPLVLLAALAYGAYQLWKRDKVYRLAVIWFLSPLLLVQDRYLYLPIFGAAMLIGGGLTALAGRMIHNDLRKSERAALAAGLVIAGVLAVLTLRYNPVWANGVALWEQGVRVDPTSAIVHAHLGNEYQRAGRLVEAKQVISRALELRPDMTAAHVARGIIAVRERRYDDAERDLKEVLNTFPSHETAREQLALAYQQQGRPNESIALFEEGRRLIPAKQSLYTINIAVLDKLAGRNTDAQSELESLLPVLNSTGDPDLLVAWWYLGELYREQGKADSAVSAYERYLRATEGSRDAQVNRLRDLANQSLQKLRQ
ncbi:MAG TPA: tetratricopeptide repeat protein [Blastocatellia bacterium]|nr:tetratricopeptide repeat protein [Blastocatellia bacterium]